MNITVTSVNERRMLDDAFPAVEGVAFEIAGVANRATSAPVGITTEVHGEGKGRHVLIGPTGAAGLPVEIGTWALPAKRYFKSTIDRIRIR